MLRRCSNWDYRQRAIYMVTLTVAEHGPLLGRLIGDERAAAIALTPVGEMVAGCWREIPGHFPGVSLMEYQVMPDHFHGVLFVRERQPKPLGGMIGFFKSHSCSLFRGMAEGIHAARGMTQDGTGDARLRPTGGPRGASMPICGGGTIGDKPWGLWSKGFQDTILFHGGQLANMRGYILDNPRRLAVKRAHPELFRVVRDLSCCGVTFAAIGNHFLLDRPVRRRVRCSRSISPSALAAQAEALLAAARRGAVLVSPCISPGEKKIARAALDAGLSLVVLLQNGFPARYKPPKTNFEACAAGRLLMLAPWPYHSGKRTITRSECLALNEYAECIAAEGELKRCQFGARASGLVAPPSWGE